MAATNQLMIAGSKFFILLAATCFHIHGRLLAKCLLGGCLCRGQRLSVPLNSAALVPHLPPAGRSPPLWATKALWIKATSWAARRPCGGEGECHIGGGTAAARGGQPPGVAVGWEFIRLPLRLHEVSVIRAG